MEAFSHTDRITKEGISMAHSIADDHANPLQQRTILLAIDNKNSVLAEVVADKTNHIAYSAYGHQSAQQEVMTRLGFNGELREMQTSWYLLGNGYRAYNPRLMRFNSPDNLSPFGAGGLNAYMYCGGEPVMNKDPTGHFFQKIFLAFRTGANNLIDTKNTFVNVYRGQIAAGQNPVNALVSSVNGEVLNTLGAPNPNGLSKLGAAQTKSLPTAKAGGLHNNVGGVPSSTPGSEASYNGSQLGTTTTNRWERLAQPESWPSQVNPKASTSGGDNPNLKITQKKSYSQVPTTTGHPSSYGPGRGASRRDPPILKSSSSPYKTTLEVESSDVRRKK